MLKWNLVMGPTCCKLSARTVDCSPLKGRALVLVAYIEEERGGESLRKEDRRGETERQREAQECGEERES